MATRPDRPNAPKPAARGRPTPPKRAFPLMRVLLGGGLLLLLLGVGFFMLNRSNTVVAEKAPGGPVETLPTRDHVPDGTKVQYTTNPPTSGNHWAVPVAWGTYPVAPPDEKLVHNLEHGGVIISYNPSKVDEATLAKLKEVTRSLRSQRTCLILTPRASIDQDKPIALTSWGVLATLDSYDEGAIRAFWRDHVARGPEFGEGQCG